MSSSHASVLMIPPTNAGGAAWVWADEWLAAAQGSGNGGDAWQPALAFLAGRARSQV